MAWARIQDGIEPIPDMKKRPSEEQILGILKGVEQGEPLPDLCRQHGLSASTFYRRRSRYRRLIVLLRREGFTDNPMRIHRLYRDEGLQVRPNERWNHEHRVRRRFSTPGKPCQNGFVESFPGKLRDECLNEHEFLSLEHARELIEAFREDYNQIRPQSSLGDLKPAAFAEKMPPRRGLGRDSSLGWQHQT